jgi:hypothetical protein
MFRKAQQHVMFGWPSIVLRPFLVRLLYLLSS